MKYQNLNKDQLVEKVNEFEKELKGYVNKADQRYKVFFERNLGKTRIDDKNRAYEFLMKFGLNRHYWNEYIFEGYANHQDDMISLAGFPDIPLSRPHSDENSERF